MASHARRTAQDSAAYLLEHLDPSMRLLDLGCGPGSISIDFGHVVSEVVGVDAAPEAIARAILLRGESKLENIGFQVADVYGLPFEDASFDVVHAHQVMQHLADPVRALIEARRVVKPGGLVAARDADYGTMVHDPHEPRLDRWLGLYHAVARGDGGEPDAGRMLPRWFSEAGFDDLIVTTSTWTYSDSESVARWRDLWVSRLLDAGLGEHAMEMGLADRAGLEDLADGWRSWAASPNPFFTFLHGEVVAKTPNPGF